MTASPSATPGSVPLVAARGPAQSVARDAGHAAVAAAVAFLLSLLVFLPGLSGPYYSDDFLFYYGKPPGGLLSLFQQRAFAKHAWRPLEAIILSPIQQHFGFYTLPLHLVSLTCHALLAGLVVFAGLRLRLSYVATGCAAVLMLVAQVATPAVIGNDTMSQVLSAMLGCSGVALFALAFLDRAAAAARLWLWAASVLACGAALFAKETAFGFLAVVAVLALSADVETRWGRRLLRAAGRLAPYVAVGLLYLLLRHLVGGPVESSGPYHLEIGRNIVANIALFTFLAVSPISFVISGIAAQDHDAVVVFVCVAAALAVLAVFVTGIVRSRRALLAGMLCLCALAALFPSFLLAHVTELYLYNAIPFLALAMGIGFAALWQRRGAARIFAVAGVAALVLGQLAADHDKSAMMAANGRRAEQLLANITPYFAHLPRGSRVYLLNPRPRNSMFSVYRLDGFDCLAFGDWRIGAVYGRPDIKVVVIEEASMRGVHPDAHTLLLALDGDTHVRVRP